jgi:hypothetical protein
LREARKNGRFDDRLAIREPNCGKTAAPASPSDFLERSASMTTDLARSAVRRRSRLGDRLFLVGCTSAYLVLVAAVIAALRMWGG